MIFVTVGTHEQSFNRLLKYIDELIEEKVITEEVFVQKGFTDYEMKNCKSSKLIPYEEMQKKIQDARIIITHGGPASFIAPLSIGKIPIVVPRKKEFNEHVNNHQLEFSYKFEKKNNNIVVVESKDELKHVIVNYDSIIKKINSKNTLNNKIFCQKLEEELKKII